MFDTIKAFAFEWIVPLLFLKLGLTKVLGVWYEYIFVELAPLKLLNTKLWKEESFTRVWAAICENPREPQPEMIDLLSQMRGVVVEIGAGTGDLCPLYRPVASLIDHVYFIEPVVAMHEKLHQRAEEANLTDKYTIITAGAEDFLPKLREFGVGAGQVDTILSIRCLCGVPGVKEHVAADLHRLLRPGGKLLIAEHTLNSRSLLVRTYQRLLDIVWPTLIGGCHLTRPTDVIIASQAKWELVNVKSPAEEPWYTVIPHCFGTYVK